MENTFYSSGKLMLTGEYVVLDGALSLSLPTKFGQYIEIHNFDNGILWNAYDYKKNKWLEVKFDNKLNLVSTHDKKSLTLKNILEESLKINPNFIHKLMNKKVNTFLEFPKDWGLGSSSSLINNIADWAEISPFFLLKNTFGGSGYDIAVAKEKKTILYHIKNDIPIYQGALFNPIFRDKIFFIYLEKKINSKEEISKYSLINKNRDCYISKSDEITKKILDCSDDIQLFSELIDEHEANISSLLNKKTIKQNFFSDFNGSIKSLGAWGGDFILALGEKQYVTQYFTSKNLNTIFCYDDIIL